WIGDGETAQGRFCGRVGRNEVSGLAVDPPLRIASDQGVILSRKRATADQRLIPGDHNLCGKWGIANGRNINAFDVGANTADRGICLSGRLCDDKSRRKDEEAEQNGGTHRLHLNYADYCVISRGVVASLRVRNGPVISRLSHRATFSCFLHIQPAVFQVPTKPSSCLPRRAVGAKCFADLSQTEGFIARSRRTSAVLVGRCSW